MAQTDAYAFAAADADGIVQDLLSRLGPAAAAAHRDSGRRIWLDSFDWRLHRAQVVLSATPDDGRFALSLERPGRVASSRRATVAHLPTKAPEIATSWIRNAVAGILDDRALLPVADTAVETRTVEVRNAAGKLVARVVLETAGDTGIARAVEIRGYRRAGSAAAGALDDVARSRQLAPVKGGLLEQLVPNAGRDPASVSLRLDRNAPAALAFVTVLRSLVDVLDATVDGAVAGLDPEFLHDYRVAVRRTRSALKQAKGVLPSDLLDCFAPELRWLQEVTGPVRDLDVYLALLDSEGAALSAERAAGLDAVRSLLQSRRTAAAKQQAADLRSDRAAALLTDWRTTLEALADNDPTAEDEADEWGPWPGEAAKPIGRVAARRVVRRYRTLIAEGSRITRSSPAEALHDLRKSAKELRYSFELFGSVLPAATVSAVVRDLKGLQDCLGQFQDTQVQQTLLSELAETLAASGAGTATMLSIGGLVDRLEQRRAQARADFVDRFRRFASGRVRTRIERLTRSRR